MSGSDGPGDGQVIKVFLLDDHEVVRRGLGDLLDQEPDFHVVGEADSAASALQAVAECEPDVAVLDIRLGDGSGIEVCREIGVAFPDVGCLLFSSFIDDESVLAAAEAGAMGFEQKRIISGELVESIRKIAAGVQLLDRAEVRLCYRRLQKSDDGAVLPLTPQERRVFTLIGNGRSNREIALEMALAEKTVKNYISNLFAKLGVTRRTEAAALAARLEERRRLRFN